jgi:hypothetical protein
MRGRLIGLICLAAGLAIGWFFIFQPLEQMRAGESDIRIGVKAFLITPMLLVAGIGLLLGGNRFLGLIDGPPETGAQWMVTIAFIILMIGAGGAGFWWFHNQMALLGYSL